jgi:hypothetical protein
MLNLPDAGIWVVGAGFLGGKSAVGSRVWWSELSRPVFSFPLWGTGSWCWEVDYFKDGTHCSLRYITSYFGDGVNDASSL